MPPSVRLRWVILSSFKMQRVPYGVLCRPFRGVVVIDGISLSISRLNADMGQIERFVIGYFFIAVKGLLYLSDNSLITSFSGLLSLSLSTMDGIAALAELYKVTISLGCKIN